MFISKNTLHDIRPALGIRIRYVLPPGRKPEDWMEAHRRVCQSIPVRDLSRMSSREARDLVGSWLAMTVQRREKWLQDALLGKFSAEPTPAPAPSLQTSWSDIWDNWEDCTLQSSPGQANAARLTREAWTAFCGVSGIDNYERMDSGTAQKYCAWRLAWRRPGDRRGGDTSARTIARDIQTMRQVVRAAVRAGMVQERYHFDDLRIPGRAKTVSPYEPEEIESLLGWCRSHGNVWEEHMILLLLNTGMRASEADAMRPEDWMPEERILRIGSPSKISGSTGLKTQNADRLIDITPVMDRLLEAGAVFESCGPIASRLGCFFRRKRQGGKIPVENPAVHRLRHTHASWLLRAASASLPQIADQLGHADAAFTRRQYAKQSAEHISSAKRREKHQSAIDKYFRDYVPMATQSSARIPAAG